MAGINFYAQNEKYVDIIKSAIIDPTTDVRAAIQNVASVAGQLITAESMVTELPKRESMPLIPSSGGMGGMGGMDFLFTAYTTQLSRRVAFQVPFCFNLKK